MREQNLHWPATGCSQDSAEHESQASHKWAQCVRHLFSSQSRMGLTSRAWMPHRGLVQAMHSNSPCRPQSSPTHMPHWHSQHMGRSKSSPSSSARWYSQTARVHTVHVNRASWQQSSDTVHSACLDAMEMCVSAHQL